MDTIFEKPAERRSRRCISGSTQPAPDLGGGPSCHGFDTGRGGRRARATPLNTNGLRSATTDQRSSVPSSSFRLADLAAQHEARVSHHAGGNANALSICPI
jgi:hypothetical protein